MSHPLSRPNPIKKQEKLRLLHRHHLPFWATHAVEIKKLQPTPGEKRCVTNRTELNLVIASAMILHTSLPTKGVWWKLRSDRVVQSIVLFMQLLSLLYYMYYTTSRTDKSFSSLSPSSHEQSTTKLLHAPREKYSGRLGLPPPFRMRAMSWHATWYHPIARLERIQEIYRSKMQRQVRKIYPSIGSNANANKKNTLRIRNETPFLADDVMFSSRLTYFKQQVVTHEFLFIRVEIIRSSKTMILSQLAILVVRQKKFRARRCLSALGILCNTILYSEPKIIERPTRSFDDELFDVVKNL
jgi:hypothetical protein